MSQKQEINKFSEESQQLPVDMNSTEIFQLCEKSAKLQCPDCNSFTEIGIIYCSCGRILKYKRTTTTTQKANCHYNSVPGLGIKQNSSRGPKHGASERQIMFFKAKEMLKIARRLDADGPQELLRQRPEFVDTLRQCLKMQDAHLAESQQSLISICPQHQ